MPVSDPADPPPKSDAQCWSVHIRFAPSLWVERPVLMERADGTYDLIGTTARPGVLAQWVLSYGPDAEVTGPERLRRRVAKEARRVWKKYIDE